MENEFEQDYTELQNNILNLIRDFEEKYDIRISNVKVNTKPLNSNKNDKFKYFRTLDIEFQ